MTPRDIDPQSAWPDFLDELDTHPQRAAEAFYRFTFRLIQVAPPRVLNQLDQGDRDDLVQDVVVYCIRDDFRVLRTYKDVGKPFAAWLFFMIRNRVLDRLKSRSRKDRTIVRDRSESSPEGLERSDAEVPRGADSSDRASFTEVLGVVRRLMQSLDEHCRLLLRMAGDELTPREMTRLLGWPPERSKKVSDDLRYCRKKLFSLLAEKGIDPQEVV